jgi:hypothetical protein
MRIAAAGLLYFAIVFGTGFILGPIRVLWLEPRVGPLVATACEAPFLLAAIVAAARVVPRVSRLEKNPASLALMGLGALLLQQLADFAVGIGLRGLSASEQLAHFATPQGLIYAALLIAFVAMPSLANRHTSEDAAH